MIFTTTNSTSTTGNDAFAATGANIFYVHIAAPPPPRPPVLPRPPAPPQPCPHRLLGVACDVQESELKRTYKRLAKALHPDVGPASEKAIRTKKMTLLNGLYDEARRQL